MSYFANIGPRSGPILGRHRLVAIGVLQAPDDRAPIGMAVAMGRRDDDVEVWELTVRGVELPGRWIVVDYKSDAVGPNLEALTAYYQPQVDHYRRYWEQLTGKPTRAGLFFIETGEEVWLG